MVDLAIGFYGPVQHSGAAFHNVGVGFQQYHYSLVLHPQVGIAIQQCYLEYTMILDYVPPCWKPTVGNVQPAKKVIWSEQ